MMNYLQYFKLFIWQQLNFFFCFFNFFLKKRICHRSTQAKWEKRKCKTIWCIVMIKEVMQTSLRRAQIVLKGKSLPPSAIMFNISKKDCNYDQSKGSTKDRTTKLNYNITQIISKNLTQIIICREEPKLQIMHIFACKPSS